eukprot:CAMPEP_0202869794 /NCGR_PEP_ID=MMETSP1391-20130828/13268_1 /ASSEMBLY_ACC=CAM_ASM_000867 /TAXON_ID=1034604 /ORGANISM="Chlamydomonas leiostraca, Strain SAG 11-49" /LENGTH=450 /DNA_ID=CAMNT_0049550175 /DNA_START=354 /DNA_END=1706 /DNA_ORIENTATION=-
MSSVSAKSLKSELQALTKISSEDDMGTGTWSTDEDDALYGTELIGLPSLVIPSWDAAAGDGLDPCLILTPHAGDLDSGAALLLDTGKCQQQQELRAPLQPLLLHQLPMQHPSTGASAPLKAPPKQCSQLVTTEMLFPGMQRAPSPCGSASPGSTVADMPPVLEDVSPYSDFASVWGAEAPMSYNQLDAAALMSNTFSAGLDMPPLTLPPQQQQQQQVVTNEAPVISYVQQRRVSRPPPRVMACTPDPAVPPAPASSWPVHDGLANGMALSAATDTCQESKASTQSVGAPVYVRTGYDSSCDGHMQPQCQWPPTTTEALAESSNVAGSMHAGYAFPGNPYAFTMGPSRPIVQFLGPPGVAQVSTVEQFNDSGRPAVVGTPKPSFVPSMLPATPRHVAPTIPDVLPARSTKPPKVPSVLTPVRSSKRCAEKAALAASAAAPAAGSRKRQRGI